MTSAYCSTKPSFLRNFPGESNVRSHDSYNPRLLHEGAFVCPPKMLFVPYILWIRWETRRDSDNTTDICHIFWEKNLTVFFLPTPQFLFLLDFQLSSQQFFSSLLLSSIKSFSICFFVMNRPSLIPFHSSALHSAMEAAQRKIDFRRLVRAAPNINHLCFAACSKTVKIVYSSKVPLSHTTLKCKVSALYY